jgi:hypothetical protein
MEPPVIDASPGASRLPRVVNDVKICSEIRINGCHLGLASPCAARIRSIVSESGTSGAAGWSSTLSSRTSCLY